MFRSHPQARWLEVPAGGDGADVGGCGGGGAMSHHLQPRRDEDCSDLIIGWCACSIRVAHFSSDGDYVSLFLFEFLTASNDFRWASVACPGVRACTLHTCILVRGVMCVCVAVVMECRMVRIFLPNLEGSVVVFKCKEKFARAWLRHRC